MSKPSKSTIAHKDIAFEFASWISVEFKLYLIKEFQRLKIKKYIKNTYLNHARTPVYMKPKLKF